MEWFHQSDRALRVPESFGRPLQIQQHIRECVLRMREAVIATLIPGNFPGAFRKTNCSFHRLASSVRLPRKFQT